MAKPTRKIRADLLLVEQGLAESRSAAQRAILAGQVRVGPDHVVRQSSETYPADTVLSLDSGPDFVSRGGGKLQPALDAHLPDLTGCVALDVGSSTGGFTDLMLQRGATRVYAVDVGTAQLHWKLRQDPRVVSLEQTNARYLTTEQIPEPIDIITSDVSFISVTLVLPAAAALLKPGGWAFILIKPQFEAQRHEAKKGVVRDEAVRQRTVDEVTAFAASQLAWRCLHIYPSPLLGPKGNQEFVAVFRS